MIYTWPSLTFDIDLSCDIQEKLHLFHYLHKEDQYGEHGVKYTDIN